MRLGPVPQRIKLALLVQLHRNHHPVAHALGASIVVGPVGDIRQRAIGIRTSLEIDALFLAIAMEELPKCALDPGLAFDRAAPQLFCEQIAIPMRLESARAIPGMTLDRDGWR